MKKLLLVSTLCIAVSGVAYASSKPDCDDANKFLTNLDLDEARAHEVKQILTSYKAVKNLAKDGRYEEIPKLIEEKNTQLGQLLTDEEFQQFKENIGSWAENMDFAKFMEYGHSYADKSSNQMR